MLPMSVMIMIIDAKKEQITNRCESTARPIVIEIVRSHRPNKPFRYAHGQASHTEDSDREYYCQRYSAGKLMFLKI